MTNKIKKFRGLFSGEKGQRTFNYAYSIGASVVILGALFKLLHWPGADFMLIVGMGTEATIFFLSAFDEPAKDYHWENVFPTLASSNVDPSQAPDFSHLGSGTGMGGGTVIIGNIDGLAAGGIGGGAPAVAASPMPAAGATPVVGGGSQPDFTAMNAATQKYVDQLNAACEQLARLADFTSALSMPGNVNFAEQMQSLGRNVQGLNTIYEIQLKSVSAQLDTIERVNAGLNQIRSLYENGTNDSFRIRQETDRMAQTLAQLNQVYERMLQAMTAGVGYVAQPAAPYAQPYGAAPSPAPQK